MSVDSVSPKRNDNDIAVISAFGVVMPRLIYGTAWKKERTAALVELALQAGFRGVDTACQPRHYNEPGVGDALSVAWKSGLSRAEIYVQTKFTPFPGQDPENVPYDAAAKIAEQVAQSFAASRRNLDVDYLDSLVLHSPYRDDKDTLEAWRAMERLFEQGGVRQLGLSNCYDLTLFERLFEQAKVKPAVIQNRFYAKTGYDREIRAFCRKNHIVYQSFWTLTANPDALAAPETVEIAAKYGKTPAQAFFRYLTQRDIACLIGSSSPEHIKEDLSIFEFRLTPAECETLDALLLRFS